MKRVVVTSLNWKETVEVDESIFEDYKMQFHRTKLYFELNPGAHLIIKFILKD